MLRPCRRPSRLRRREAPAERRERLKGDGTRHEHFSPAPNKTPPEISGGASRSERPGGSRPASMRQRIGAKLEVHGDRLAALAALAQPRRAVAARRPQAAALPAGIGIVDASVETFGVEA